MIFLFLGEVTNLIPRINSTWSWYKLFTDHFICLSNNLLIILDLLIYSWYSPTVYCDSAFLTTSLFFFFSLSLLFFWMLFIIASSRIFWNFCIYQQNYIFQSSGIHIQYFFLVILILHLPFFSCVYICL